MDRKRLQLRGVCARMLLHSASVAVPARRQRLPRSSKRWPSRRSSRTSPTPSRPRRKSPSARFAPRSTDGATAWVVRNGRGETLRRFADTNGDNVVDLWCYFNDGLESYRDIDSDFNGKADQYRWFQTSGTRWGIDKNEDGRIDSWKVISAPEVAEELVFALKNRDRARFELLLLTPPELTNAGFGPQQTERLAATIKAAPAAFAKLAAEQKVVHAAKRIRRLLPHAAGHDSRRHRRLDQRRHDPRQRVGAGHQRRQARAALSRHARRGRRHLEVARRADDRLREPAGAQRTADPDDRGRRRQAAPAAGGPSEEMQKLMAELEKLDQQASQAGPGQQGPLTDRRAEILTQARRFGDRRRHAVASGSISWPTCSAAPPRTPRTNYTKGLEQLDQLAADLAAKNPNDPLGQLREVPPDVRGLRAEPASAERRLRQDSGKVAGRPGGLCQRQSRRAPTPPRRCCSWACRTNSPARPTRPRSGTESWRRNSRTRRRPRRPAACLRRLELDRASRCDSRPRTSRAGRSNLRRRTRTASC